jgi:hypothetical protein
MVRQLVGYGVALLVLGGCASHTIFAERHDATGTAGQSFRHNQTSYFGAQGLNSDGLGYVSKECRSGDLKEVVVNRSFGQGLITALTLGIVSPVTIAFKCEKVGAPPPEPGDDDDPF